MKVVKGGVTKPRGFKASGICCGIKRSGKLDLALITSDIPAAAAGVFTKNSIIAAPLVVSKKHLKNGKAQAIICNSGNANCFTGDFGLIYARRTTERIAKLLNIPKEDVIVTSTGIIGKALPYTKIQKGAAKLVEELAVTGTNATKAAKAIMTTDLKVKEIAGQITVNNKMVYIGGCAKGSGMVAPNMATMLGFVTTDLDISPRMLKMALKEANELSFNRITVDGCMSTNDMVVVLANGLAKNKSITTPGKEYNTFVKALSQICLDLAKKIVIDGEGATKFIEVKVIGAKTEKQAKNAALTVANSVLVKTAAFGSNPNWGRVAAAVGSLGIEKVTEKNLKIDFSPFDKKEIMIKVDLNIGSHEAVVYTCDLSYEYIRINGEYN